MYTEFFYYSSEGRVFLYLKAKHHLKTFTYLVTAFKYSSARSAPVASNPNHSQSI